MKAQLLVCGVSYGDIEIDDFSILGLMARGEFGAASSKIKALQASLAQTAAEAEPGRVVRGDELVFDPLTRMVRGPDGRQILRPLAKRQAAFLGVLLKTGRASHQELALAIWGQRPPVNTKAGLAAVVWGLRERLDEIDADTAIAVVQGYGYVLYDGEVSGED